MNFYDTIAAVSSPVGKGGVAVIRISGTEAISVADKVFKCASGKSVYDLKPNMMVYGTIIFEEKVIDDGLCVKFCAPKSFTGEDTVEINCHGGIYITQRVLSAVFAAGARPAEAGEFTRRAFVNGKMALSQAEALGTLLEAKSDGQIDLARSVMGGKIKESCDKLYKELVALVEQVYAKVDYPEEDLADMDNDKMTVATRELLEKVQKLKATYKMGHAVMEGVAMSLLDCKKYLQEKGVKIGSFAYIIGGGAKSKVWRQIVADTLNLTLVQTENNDSSFGSAMCAGISAGFFKDFIVASQKCQKIIGETMPIPENTEKYAKIFEKYKKISSFLTELADEK